MTSRYRAGEWVHMVTIEPVECGYNWCEEVLISDTPPTIVYQTHHCPRPAGHEGDHGCWIEGCEATHE